MREIRGKKFLSPFARGLKTDHPLIYLALVDGLACVGHGAHADSHESGRRVRALWPGRMAFPHPQSRCLYAIARQ